VKIVHTTYHNETKEEVVEQKAPETYRNKEVVEQKATAIRVSYRGYPERETIVEARSEEDGRWFTATSWRNGDTITIVTIEIEL
jgi:hypothetical protein